MLVNLNGQTLECVHFNACRDTTYLILVLGGRALNALKTHHADWVGMHLHVFQGVHPLPIVLNVPLNHPKLNGFFHVTLFAVCLLSTSTVPVKHVTLAQNQLAILG